MDGGSGFFQNIAKNFKKPLDKWKSIVYDCIKMIIQKGGSHSAVEF